MQNVNYCPQDELDEELNIDLKKILFALWNRKELIVKVFVGIFVFFILLTFILPKKYKVDADLYINKSNNSNMAEINPYFISEVGTGSGMAAMLAGGGTLANDLEIMQSPLVIDEVIRENDLRFKKLFGIIPTKKTGQYLTTEKFLKKGISFENKKGTNVVTIEYKNKDRELAYNVVSSIITHYIAVNKELNTEKSKSDKKIIEKDYLQAKEALNEKVNVASGIPEQAMTSAGNLSAMSAFSTSAQKAIGSLTGQIIAGQKSRIEVTEEAAKVAELSKKLEWARLVEEMSDSSKVVVLKAPRLLKDYEQASPKLFTNILLGIVFGIIGALGTVIFKENTDRKLTYSMLGDNIIYNIEKDYIDFKSVLLAEKKEKISFVICERISETFLNQLKPYSNINCVKADISDEFEYGVQDSSKVIIMAKIGKTDAKLYKRIKALLEKMNKKVILEILV